MNDLIIKNAIVIDGTGAKARAADVSISAGRISAIGQQLGDAREVIDAHGLHLMPGVIDGHTHYDAQLTWDAFADPSLSLGSTTVVIGNCGFGLAPCRPEHRNLMVRHLVHVEGMSEKALINGIQWEFETFPEYMQLLERRGVGPNVAAYVGHSAVRAFVMGDQASARVASDAEIQQMQDIVRQAMRAGACGFSTSTAVNHVGDGGLPMPSLVADDREMRALVNAMAEGGSGAFMIHKDKKATSFAYIESLLGESGRPALISNLRHYKERPDHVFNLLAEIHAAQARGHKLYGQAGCLPILIEFTLKNCSLFYGLDVWQPVVAAIQNENLEQLRSFYSNPDFRRNLRQQIVTQHGQAVFDGHWNRVFVGAAARPENVKLEGQSIQALADIDGKDALDWFFDFGLGENMETLYSVVLANDDEEGVNRLINDPYAQICLSDGGAHYSFLCDAGFAVHLLGHFVRERGLMTLEQAAYKLCGQQAELFGMRERGVLAPGKAADLMLFDPATIGVREKRRLYDLPGGEGRIAVFADGVHGVWVNGTRVVDEHGLMRDGPRSGKVLREFA